MVTHVFTVLFYVKITAAVKEVYNVHVNCIDESWEKLYSVFVYTAMSRCVKRNRNVLGRPVSSVSRVRIPCAEALSSLQRPRLQV